MRPGIQLLNEVTKVLDGAGQLVPGRPNPSAQKLLGWFRDPKKAIRDPIYDQIKLNELERSVLRTAEFQRLRWIRQMDFAYLVYPAAEHSRFTHSLGVCQATKDLFDQLASSYEERLLSLARPRFARPQPKCVIQASVWLGASWPLATCVF